MSYKNLKIYIIFLSFIFFSLNLYWHSKYIDSEKKNYFNEQNIIFYKLQAETIRLTDKLIYEYMQQKNKILDKHILVENYLKGRSNYLSIDLNEIYEEINKEFKDQKVKPFNIYIADENYIIQNTTYKPDLNFDISFAKDIFNKNYKNGKVGISKPTYETYSNKFFSYTDQYIFDHKGKKSILQVSYTYYNIEKYLKKLKNILSNSNDIVKLKSYIHSKNAESFVINLDNKSSYKPDIKTINKNIDLGKKLMAKKELGVTIENYSLDEKSYKKIYLVTNNNLLESDLKFIYSIVFDESAFNDYIENLKIFNLITIVCIFLFLFIYLIYINKNILLPLFKLKEAFIQNKYIDDTLVKSKNKEIKDLFIKYNEMQQIVNDIISDKEILLKDKNKFIHNAVHEINTPLSVISTSNSLRDLSQGECEYSQNIVSAVKTLKNTMDDLNYSIHDNKVINKECINLNKFMEERVNYFEQIAQSSNLELQLNGNGNGNGNCLVFMDVTDLTRLIDNNISNAIKYSFPNTNIQLKVIVNNKDNIIISFSSYGKKIENTNEIFERYYREYNEKGGFGLGLNIVKNICDRYGIKINVQSQDKKNTFLYTIKCHTKIMT